MQPVIYKHGCVGDYYITYVIPIFELSRETKLIDSRNREKSCSVKIRKINDLWFEITEVSKDRDCTAVLLMFRDKSDRKNEVYKDIYIYIYFCSDGSRFCICLFGVCLKRGLYILGATTTNTSTKRKCCVIEKKQN